MSFHFSFSCLVFSSNLLSHLSTWCVTQLSFLAVFLLTLQMWLRPFHFGQLPCFSNLSFLPFFLLLLFAALEIEDKSSSVGEANSAPFVTGSLCLMKAPVVSSVCLCQVQGAHTPLLEKDKQTGQPSAGLLKAWLYLPIQWLHPGIERLGESLRGRSQLFCLSRDHSCSLHSLFDSGIAGRINHGGFSVDFLCLWCLAAAPTHSMQLWVKSCRQLWVKSCLSILSLPPGTDLFFRKAQKIYLSCVCTGTKAQAGWAELHSVPGRDAQVTLSCTCKRSRWDMPTHTWMHICISRSFYLEAELSVAVCLGRFCPFVLLSNDGRKEMVQSSQHTIRKKLETDFENLRTSENHVPFLPLGAFSLGVWLGGEELLPGNKPSGASPAPSC